MSLAVGAASSSKIMGFDKNKDGEEKSHVSGSSNALPPPSPTSGSSIVIPSKALPPPSPTSGSSNALPPPSPTPTQEALAGEKYTRQLSEASLYGTEDEEDDEESKLELGPQCTLKEQLEKDKEDESLRKWKEQLLGSVDFNSVGETLEPDVKILSLYILSPGRPELVLPIPEAGNPKGVWFTLKEGSHYSLKFSFKVNNNIVSGLKYTNTVWKTGLKVDNTKEMLGVFGPQAEPYTHEMPEETTPSGIFARGSYSARTKFLDDDNKCYLEINYTFDIKKEWPST